MDPVRNPFGPGAGTPPPQLSGRAGILREADIALQRKLLGKSHRSVIMVGLRGVGKTVLLQRIAERAKELGYKIVPLEIREERSLAISLAPVIRSLLYELDRMQGLSEAVKRGLRVLRSFASGFSLRMGEIDLGMSIDPEIGVADSGDLASDLTELFVAVSEAAKARETAIALCIDELQYLDEDEFGALIMALHRVTQLNLPLTMFAAGLPSIRGIAGRSKSYAERLFEYPEIGALESQDIASAVSAPAEQEGVQFTKEALSAIEAYTKGYPYFVQEWAYQGWNVAQQSPVTATDILSANALAIARLDESFFQVRFDRVTPSERRYMRAMAELGQGPYRSGDVARIYGAKLASVGPVRASLIRKGMIYSASHGDTDFTVPMFDEYMRRKMPLLSEA